MTPLASGRVLVVLTALLIGSALAGCSTDPNDPYSWLGPVTTPPPRAGTSVWVVGAPDLVFHSSDGGTTWRESHRSETDIFTGDLWAIAFGDSEHGWAVRRGVGDPRTTVLATADGGASWSWQYPKPQAGALLAVAASGPRHAWAMGRRPGDSLAAPGLVIATTDGGATWTRQRLDPDLQPFDVAFTDSRHGWLLARERGYSDRSVVLVTTDGGVHWRVSYSTRAAILNGIAAVGLRQCWIAGYVEHPRAGFVALTRDGGEHWTEQRPVAGRALHDVDFPDARHGWAVGDMGTIIATMDGGRTWAPQYADRDLSLLEVSFADDQRGWALISHVALLATADGGATWGVVRPNEAEDLLTGLTCIQSGSQSEP